MKIKYCPECGKELIYENLEIKDYTGINKVKTWFCPDKCIIFRWDKFGEVIECLKQKKN